MAETCKHLLRGAPDCVFCHRDQLKRELSLAEEGLANYAQEVEQLKAERDQWKKRADELFFAESPGHPTGEPK